MSSVRALAWWWCVVALGSTGCGPASSNDGDGDGTGSASHGSTTSLASTDASAASTVTDVTTRGDTTQANTGPATTDATDTTSDTETGETACPPPEDVTMTFSVSPNEPLSATCTVVGVTSDEPSTTIDLDCSGEDVTLVVDITPASATPYVSEGALVQIDHIVDQIFWTNRWLALRTAGGESDQLLLGAVEGSALDPPGTTLEAFLGGGSFGAPAVTVAEGLCMPVDDEFCGLLERLALDFDLARLGSTRAFDHGTAFVDVLAFGWAYTVEEVTQYPEQQTCDDVPQAWFDFAMIWFPSD